MWVSLLVLYSGARFWKVPKLYEPFPSVPIPPVSQELRGIKSSNFTVSLLLVTLKTCLKIGVPKQGFGRFTNGSSGPKRFRDFRETGPAPKSFALVLIQAY